jgi:hypothetical protein
MNIEPKPGPIDHRRRLIVGRAIHDGRRWIIAAAVIAVIPMMPMMENRMAMPMVVVAMVVVVAAVVVGVG